MWDADDTNFLVADDVEFDRATARELYRTGFGDTNLSARWSRIYEDVTFVDVVEALHGNERGLGRLDPNGMISCPFHGTDRRASFKLYKGSNDAYCFGCPEGEKHWDSVRFVAAKYGYTPLQAIHWLEKEYELPPLTAEDEEEEDPDSDIVVVNLNFSHLAEPYIRVAAAAFQKSLDPELAREYLTIFFEAVPGLRADLNSEEELKKVTPLARVLGWKAVEEIKKRRLR